MSKMETNLESLAKIFDYVVKDEPVPSLPEDLREIVKGPFTIGYIVGDSGTSKSVCLKHIIEMGGYTCMPTITDPRPIAALFDNIELAMERLTMAGLSSVPVWFRSYDCISSGEKFRADIAKNLTSFQVIDEFTSNLDRLTARSLSASLRKYVDRNGVTNILVAGCQYDIIPWLKPDFVYDMNIKGFHDDFTSLPNWTCEAEGFIEDVPILSQDMDEKKLVLRRTKRDRWSLYAPHHYLTTSLLTNSTCWEAFVKVEGVERAIGFIAVAPLPSGTILRGVREHRLVVIPSCQGTGVGIVMSETIAQLYVDTGYQYYTKSSHPRLGAYRTKSLRWTETSKNRAEKSKHESSKYWTSTDRLCYCHAYNGKISATNIVPKVTTVHKLSIVTTPVKTDITVLRDTLFPAATWLPLKLYGTIKQKRTGDVVARINHKEVYFRLIGPNCYPNTEAAIEAANEYIVKESMSAKTNWYTVISGVAYIDLSVDNKGTCFLMVDVGKIQILSGKVWRERYSKAFAYSEERKRMYVEEILFPGRKITQYIDGNKLNNRENNLIFLE